MTDEAAQSALWTTARELTQLLYRTEGSLQHRGDTEHFHHREFSWRSRSLSLYLSAALDLAEKALYGQAFALLRSALEHHCIDQLMFLATRVEQVFENVPTETYRAWKSQPPEGAISVKQGKRGQVTMVMPGLPVQNSDGSESGRTLSIYYYWWHQFDPFLSKLDPARVALDYAMKDESGRALSSSQRAIWNQAFRWESLRHNLELNELASGSESFQLDVHYGFLSAFAHPAGQRPVEGLYPWNAMGFGNWPVADHYSEELALIYCVWLASEEMRRFKEMTERDPAVDLSGWSETARLLRRADREISHGWMPWRAATTYDRATEANQRMWSALDLRGGPIIRPDFVDPSSLSEEEVRYYLNPLRRLIAIHQGFHEGLTGIAWNSPWPRQDARNRRV